MNERSLCVAANAQATSAGPHDARRQPTPRRRRVGRTGAIASLLALALAGCGGSDGSATSAVSANGDGRANTVPRSNGGSAAGGDVTPAVASPAGSEVVKRYEVTLVNLTAGQPLSPMVVLLHRDGLRLFDVGEPASVALEALAEGAATDPLIALARSSNALAADTVIGSAPIAPGGRATAMLDLAGDATGLKLSGATMLVNTNDAIAAVNGRTLDTLAVDETMTIPLLGYDTGTEANDERAAHIPGPAGGGRGEGFNPARDDIANRVHVHPGAITADDGLAGSALREVHRWDHPVARLLVRRLQ